VAYTPYFRGLRAAAASAAAMLTLLEPLTGTVLATVVLGERLTATGIAGAVILSAAVLLTVRAHTQPTGTAGRNRERQNSLAQVAVGDGD
jgi:drug/metabolite transporter, DME family